MEKYIFGAKRVGSCVPRFNSFVKLLLIGFLLSIDLLAPWQFCSAQSAKLGKAYELQEAGNEYYTLGNFEKVEESLKEAIGLFKAEGEYEPVVKCYLKLSKVYRFNGNTDLQSWAIGAAKEICDSFLGKDHPFSLEILVREGGLWANLLEVSKASEHLYNLLPRLENEGRSDLVVDACNSLAYCYLQLDDMDMLREVLNQAWIHLGSLDSPVNYKGSVLFYFSEYYIKRENWKGVRNPY